MENHTYSSPLLDKKNPFPAVSGRFRWPFGRQDDPPGLSSSTASSSLTSSSFSSSSSPPNSSSISTSTNTNTTSSSISYIYTSPNSSTNHSSPAPTLVTSSDTSSNRNEKGNFERIFGYASCHDCKKTYVYNSNSGTSHLKQHSCVLNQDKSSRTNSMKQTTVEQVLTVQKTLTDDQSNVVKDLIAGWICTDIRPFSIIEDNGLRLLIQECIRLGSLYGNVDVNDMLRGRTTISNHIYKLANWSRSQMKLLLQEPFENRCLSISPDFWTDKYRQISYLGVTVTFVDSDYHYHTIDLFCRPFEEPDKSSTNVLIALQAELASFGIDDLFKVTIVCDRGANFLKAFRYHHPILCYAHRLNNILKRTFFQHSEQSSLKLLSHTYDGSSCSEVCDDDDNLNNISKPKKNKKKKLTVSVRDMEETAMTIKVNEIPTAAQYVIKTILECKSLAKYIKKSGLNKEIKAVGGNAIHQATNVRWLSLIDLLESMRTSYTQIKAILSRRKQQSRLTIISQNLLDDIVRFLKPFKSIMKIIQAGSTPTLYLILPCTLVLRKVCNSFEYLLEHVNKHQLVEGEKSPLENNVEDDALRQYEEGEGILILLSNMLDLDHRYYCATILHPDYRTLRGCSTEEKVACYRYIREQLKIMNEETSNNDVELQKNKRIKSSHLSILDDFKDDPEATDDDDEHSSDNDDDDEDDFKSTEYSLSLTKSDELNKYLGMKVDMNEYSSDVLLFWKRNTDEFPCLSKLARRTHSIPATSAGVERQFSTAGLILSERRNNLDPEQLDNILSIRAMEIINAKM
ncbi:unnamed protein product [Rotaria magnacalcarata]|uniref:Transposase n=1 Tax=Rotaria magnacalcarata TaxID=392030 RepID=A0A819EMG3_9BILA|nr:unnamed protein product [Rotaria magnacalcarata]